MLIRDILIIIFMLLGAALFGYLIGWFRKSHKFEELEGYIAALEDKNNRIQTDLKENEKILIDCQTEKKKLESGKDKIEKPKKGTKTKKTKTKADNLTKIEGIGPKLAGILKNAGIETFKDLSKEKAEKISEILVEAEGNKYKRFDPATWPDQAKLAADGKWDELNKWQEELKGGR